MIVVWGTRKPTALAQITQDIPLPAVPEGDDRRTATTADYANEFPCCGGAFDFDRYHLRHFEVFSVLPSPSTSRRRAGRQSMIARADQMVANCTAGGAQAADVLPWRASYRPNGSIAVIWLFG
jgi:hypothetical protein